MKKLNKVFATVFASSILVSPISALALTKNETVYSNLNAYGTVSKTTVTNHLSYVGSKDVQDETYLTNILNVNGDEKFSLNGSSLTWKGNCEDIYYQGVSSKDVPIKTEIKYYLDGKETKVENLIGKSGKIKINIKLTNTEKNTVKVNGKKKTLYTPYVSTIGMVLGENAKNVQVSNGKVVETGSRSIVAGIAAPGLYDSLKLDDLSDLDRITINYTTTNFEFNDIYIVSTPKLLQEVDTEVFDKLDELTNSINELQDNMDKIEDGSNEIAKGSEKLASTVKKEKDSTSNVLNNKQIEEIQKQAKSTVSSQFTSDKKQETIDNAWATTKDTLDNSTDTTVTEYVTDEMKTIITAYLVALGMTQTQAEQLAPAYLLYTTIDPVDDPQTEQQRAALTAVTTYLSSQLPALNVFAATVKVSAASTAKKTTYYIAENVSKNAAETGYDTVKETSETVASQVSGSVAQKVAIQVKSTVLNTLYGDDKNAGINQLNKGIQTLNEGIEQYNEQGICVLSKYADKIDNYSSTAEALVNLSKKYNGYGSDNAKETTFISIVKNK